MRLKSLLGNYYLLNLSELFDTGSDIDLWKVIAKKITKLETCLSFLTDVEQQNTPSLRGVMLS